MLLANHGILAGANDLLNAFIVGEEVAQDKTRQMILKLAAPSGLRVVYFSPEKLIKVLEKSEVTRSTLLLFTNPREVYECIEAGVNVEIQMVPTDKVSQMKDFIGGND